MKDEQILYSSDRAAKYVTNISGWVDSKGRFWGNDEHMARYSGCTHIDCKDCGKPIPVRGYTICSDCREKKNIERYNAMPCIEWDGETPVYSQSDNQYFFDEDELRDYTEDHQCSIDSLRLVICKPNEFRLIDYYYFSDELPEDAELPEEIEMAIDELNMVISRQPPVSWSPGEHAVTLNFNTRGKTK